MKELNEKLAIVQTELKAKKSSYNSFGKYYFRKSEDILEAIKPFLLKHNVSVTVNEKLVSFNPPIMETTATIFDGKDAIDFRRELIDQTVESANDMIIQDMWDMISTRNMKNAMEKGDIDMANKIRKAIESVKKQLKEKL